MATKFCIYVLFLNLKNWKFVTNQLKFNNNFRDQKEYQQRGRYNFIVIIKARKYNNKYKQEQLSWTDINTCGCNR